VVLAAKWPNELPIGAAAWCQAYLDGSGNIVEADILLNAQAFSFTTRREARGGSLYVEDILAKEIGRSLGIGLGGDERRRGSEPFRALFAQAAAAGLHLTNHAGETTGPEAIREALSIGSERIGHALSAIRDFYLMEELKERRIPLELNPTSNIRTGVCTSYADHPLKKYFKAGLLVTLNSDDPAFFGSDIANEYLLAYKEHGFTRDELRQLAANSIQASFLPSPAKIEWIFRIDSTK